MELNKYQTPIEELKHTHVDENTGEQTYFTWNTCPEEIKEEFNEAVSTIPFIQWLINPNRPLCKDLPRDENGRAIWKITEPPIIEDTDYFRQTAIHFQRTGRYTDLRPNPNPNSAYRKWIDQEADRIYNGMLRESDGAWIPGDMYWYLNYSPIILTVTGENENVGERDTDFPRFWEGILWRSIGWTDARRVGQNFAEIAKRGASKAHPYCQEVITPEGPKLWKDIQVGDYLFGDDGLPTKVIDIPFDDKADIYKVTLSDGREILASDEHLWRVKVHCHKNEEVWSTTKLLQEYKRKRKVTDRNPNGIELVCGIPANAGVDFEYQQTKVDPYTFGLLLGDGCFRHQSCYYTCEDNDFKEISEHIPYTWTKWKAKYAYRLNIPNWKSILMDYGLFFKKSEDKFIPDEYKYNSKKVRLNILKGLMDSDGYLAKHGLYAISTTSKRLADDIRWICYSLGYNTRCTKQKAGYRQNGIYKECLPTYIITIYTYDVIVNLSRKVRTEYWSGNYAKNRAAQTRISNIEYVGKMPAKCVTVDNQSHCYLIGDFVVTHNSYYTASKLSKIFIMGERKRTEEEIKAKKPQNAGGVVIAYDKQFLIKDGTLNKFEQMIDHCANNTQFPRKTLQRTLNEMSWEMGYIDLNTGAKSGTRNTVLGVAVKDDPDKVRGKRKNFICFEEFGKFPNLSDTYNISLKSVKEGNTWFGMIALIGTGGEEGNDFSSAMDMIYHPTGFFMRAYPNVWDKSAQTRGVSIFFFPAYINRAGCYNKDGISDVTSALFSICCERWIAKYHNPDPMQLTRTKAEDPITIQDAIMRRDGTKFPVAQITERIQEIDLNPNFYDDMYVGKLVQKSNGEVIFEPTGDTPIRKFPTKDNKVAGAVEIKALPVRGANGKVMPNRYIAGLDPIDDDSSDTMSLVSIFILDLFTDEIVAEWTGRLDSADACYEVCRLLLIFYNAKVNYENNKKGFHAYMKMKHCLHYLEEEPEIIRAKSNTKVEKVGNKLYGTNATVGINEWGRDLIKDYMLKGITQVKNGQDEDEVTIPNVMTWWNRALLEEARQWNPDGNFDRISAIGMLMILREDRRAKFGSDFSGLKKVKQENTKAADPFFERNYNHGKLPVVAQQGFHLPSTQEKIQWQ